MSKHTSQCSFTLVEIMVAAVIMVIVASGIVTTVLYAKSLVTKEREQLIGLEFTYAVLEELLFATEFDDFNLSVSAADNPHLISDLPVNELFWSQASPLINYTVTNYQIDRGGPSVPATDPLFVAEAKRIDVTLTWQGVANKGKTSRNTTLSSIKIR